ALSEVEAWKMNGIKSAHSPSWRSMLAMVLITLEMACRTRDSGSLMVACRRAFLRTGFWSAGTFSQCFGTCVRASTAASWRTWGFWCVEKTWMRAGTESGLERNSFLSLAVASLITAVSATRHQRYLASVILSSFKLG